MHELTAPLPISTGDEKVEKPDSFFRHMPALDGVRAIAIIVVMIYHLEWLMPELQPYVKGGFLGVDIFFVLSGFLITSILLGEYEKTGTISLKNFYVRRCLRLVPAFWLFLICLYVFGSYLLPEYQASLVYGRNDFIYAITYTMNWFSAFNSGYDSNLNHAWSLSIEEQFYIIWSLILYYALAKRWKPRKMLFVTLGLVLALCISRAIRAILGVDTKILYYSTDTRIDALLTGCAASLAFVLKVLPADVLRKSWFNLLLAGSVVGALMVFVRLSHFSVYLYIFGLPVFTSSIAVMLFWLVSTTRTIIHKVLENRILVWIGNISYALYLWHYLMYEFAKKEFETPGSRMIVGLTLAFIAAAGSYYLIEKPFLRLKFRFNTKGHGLMVSG
jgi:peptidoglycan/LPS O-acetylase OafA/YrhL